MARATLSAYGPTRRIALSGVVGIGLALAEVRSRAATILPLTGEESAGTYIAQRGGEISIQQAVSIALTRYPGRLVRAEPTIRGSHITYEIRILGERGRVRTVRVDAATGKSM